MPITLDLMEYATDLACQQAYVTDAGESVTQSQLLSDTDITIDWDVPQDAYFQGFKVAIAAPVTRFTLKLKYVTTISGTLTGYIYSDDGSGKPSSALATFSNMAANTLTTSFVDYDFTGTFTPTIGAQYHIVIIWTGGSATDDLSTRLYVTTNAYADGACGFRQTTWQLLANYDYYFKVYQTILQSYSESTIKSQGSYSLKGKAAITNSLNKTLTRTVSPTIDLSGQDQVKFDIRASRTGSNIKIGIRDSEGTITEITPNILIADTYQTVILSLYGISKANKDAIDRIIITIVNADAENIFYIDNLYGLSITIAVSDYQIELRDKDGNLKSYLTPFVSKVNWEWNRIGGCGRCSITINKAYRDILFDARDDIQIRVKSGATSKLVYRGYLANIVPVLKVNQEITLDVRGYFDLLKKIIVHTDGDTRTYTSKTVAYIADDIADTFIVPKTPITIAGALTAGDFTADKLEFLGSVEDALRTLSELQGDIEYGVDEDLVFYWKTESTTINAKFFVGNNVSVLERRVKWDDLVNKIYLIGGEISGVKYKITAENTDSQNLYKLAEEIINNSSITTASVAAQYLGAILTEKAIPQFSIRAQVKNTDLRLEDTIPMGLLVFYDVQYDQESLGDVIGDIIGESFGGIKTVAIKAGGSGYTNGAQVLTVVQSGASGGTINVTVSGGVVTAIVSVATQGTNYTTTGVGGTGANGLATTGGGGTGCTLNISVLNITSGTGSNIVVGETAAGGSNILVGGQYSAQVDRISYSLSDTPGRFNLEIQLGDTVLETSAKIKRLEMALANLNQD